MTEFHRFTSAELKVIPASQDEQMPEWSAGAGSEWRLNRFSAVFNGSVRHESSKSQSPTSREAPSSKFQIRRVK